MCANSWIDEPLWTSASPWSNDVLYHINSDLYIMYEPFQNNSYLNFDDPNTGGTSPGAVPINAGFITLIVMLLFYVLYKLSFVKSSHD